MTNIVLLDNQAHRDLKVQPGAAARYGDNKRFVAVVAGEFPFLAAHYPILLTKDANTGAFLAGAMLGIDEGENLFLTDRGMDSYRPLNLQRGPFFTSGSDVAIDLDSPRIDAAGQPLFTETGEPAPYLQSILALFRDLRPGLDITKSFVETLVKLRLIEPIDISLTFDDGTRRQLEDLYTVNQDALRALPDAQVLELFRSGYLQLIYLMIASLKHVPVLARMKNNRLLAGTDGLLGT